MTKVSLTNLCEALKYDINICQGELKTDLHVDREEGIITISACGLTLAYDPNRFKKDKEIYATEQLKTHQKYHEMVRKELFCAYKDLHEKLDKESDLERGFQFIPEDIQRPIIEFAKLVTTPLAWITFRSLGGIIREDIQNGELVATGYSLVEAAINYGKHFVEKIIEQSNGQLPEIVKVDLVEWEKVQKELSYLYSRLVATSEKKVEVDKRMYKLLFPNSKI